MGLRVGSGERSDLADNGMAGEEGEVRVGAYLADDDVVGAGVVVQLLVPLLHHAALMRGCVWVCRKERGPFRCHSSIVPP